MTTPSFRPESDAGASGDATQPVSGPSASADRPTPPAAPWQGTPSGAQPAVPTPPGPTFQSGPTFEPTPFQPTPPEPGPAFVAPVAQHRSSGGSRVLNIALAVAVLVATAGVAFAVGRTTAPASASTAGRFNGTFGGGAFPDGSFAPNGENFRGGNGAFRAGLGAFGGGLTIQGTVQSVSGDSITITTTGGQSVTIGLDSSTTYHQQSAATATNVQAGKTVIIDLSGGFRPGTDNGNNGNSGNNGNGGVSLGTASDVTVVP